MDPKGKSYSYSHHYYVIIAVRPDRDAAGRTHPIRHRRTRGAQGDHEEEEEEENTAEWIRKLPVDMRTLLMQLMNIDLIITSGDTHTEPSQLYPLKIDSLKSIIEEPSFLDGKRCEVRRITIIFILF